MWSAIVAASSVAVSAAMAEQRRQYQKVGEDTLRLMAKTYGPQTEKVRVLTPSKCPGCGSREFKNHHGKQVCSFCRIEATYDQD
jgi:predicted Zn-ribbon and HTH transcriptional regulator